MTKRKRKVTQSPSKSARQSQNPFLAADESHEDDPIAACALAEHALTFYTAAQESEPPTPALLSTVEALLEHLVYGSDDIKTLSKSEVAMMLLPWAVRQVLTTKRTRTASAVVWQTLRQCLSILPKDGRTDAVLSQSTLFKLVPRVALVAVRLAVADKDEDDDNAMDDTFGLLPSRSETDEASTDSTNDGHAWDICEDAGASYCLLVEHHFRPTLDVACTKLLIPIMAAVQDVDTHQRVLAQPATKVDDGRVVVRDTLMLIKSLHFSRKGNPKTAFQLFASRSVLLAMSRAYFSYLRDLEGILLCDMGFFTDSNELQEPIRELLYDGFFHAKHHIEGFRSLLTTKSKATDDDTSVRAFRCYQDELFASLQSAMALRSDAGADGSRDRIHDAKDCAWLAPVLLRGFLEGIDEWGRDKRKAEEVSRLQFQAFRQFTTMLRSMVIEALRLGEQDLAAVGLHSMVECLNLLGLHNIYLPSHDDKETSQFSCLESITVDLLKVASESPSDGVIGVQQLADSLKGLQYIVQLDHRLVGDRLVSLLSTCRRCSDVRLHASAVDTLVGVFDTYRKLRQLNQLMRSIFEVLISSSEHTSEFAVLVSHLEDCLVLKELARAVQESPILELKSVFEEMRVLFSSVGDRQRCELSRAIVDVLVVVIRNVRVTGDTAVELESLCQSLLGGLKDLADEKVQLVACGWLLELHTRCAFWIGRSAVVKIPEGLMALLVEASTAVTDQTPDSGKGRRLELAKNDDELLFLACHRLRLLHSLIYDQERLELESKGDGGGGCSKREALVREANSLAAFVANLARLQRRQSTRSSAISRWVSIAEHFASWEPYASDHHVDWFLKWLLSIVSVDPSSPILPPEAMAYRERYNRIEEELECARALLADVYFFEHERVTARFEVAALSSAAEIVASAISELADEDDSTRLASHVAPILGDGVWERMSIKRLLKRAKGRMRYEKPGEDQVSSIQSRLKQACQPLLISNGLDAQCKRQSEKDALDCVNSCLRLEQASCSLAALDKRIRGCAMCLVACLRLTLSQLLERFPHLHDGLPFSAPGTTLPFLSAYHDSSVALVGKESLVSTDSRAMLCGTVQVTRQLVRCALNSAEFSKCEDELLDLMKTKKGELLVHARTRAILGRPILQTIAEHVGDCLTSGNFEGRLRDCYWNLFLLASAETDALDENESDGISLELRRYTPEAILLLADLLVFSRKRLLHERPLGEEKARLIRALPELLSRPSLEAPVYEALDYFVACSVKDSQFHEIHIQLGEAMVNLERSSPVLNATFCQIVNQHSDEDLPSLLSLLSSTQKMATDHRLRRVVLSLTVLGNRESVEAEVILRDHGPRFFAVALSGLNGYDSQNDTAMSAFDVIQELLRRRSVMVFRETDLARLVSHMSTVLGPRGANQGVGRLPSEVFVAATQTFATMFQRYPKQLYACAPSVVSLLHSLLARVVHEDIPQTEMVVRMHHFARVCELFVGHKDIYRKHLVGVVLEFVDELNKGLDASRKELLIPAIYCLLDSLSQYETKQLNAMMDTHCKVLFRSVYQSYQKKHAYKGQ